MSCKTEQEPLCLEGEEGHKRVLVVDDDPDVVEMLALRLNLEGYTVLGCGSASQAVEVAQTFRPDSVIVDLNMPEKSGIEAIIELRSWQPGLKASILSAQDHDDRLVEQVIAATGDDIEWHSKTDPFSELLKFIERPNNHHYPLAS